MNHSNNIFKPFPHLETERCILSSISEKDKNDIFKIYGDTEIMKYMQRNPIERIDEALELINFWNKLRNENKGIRWGVFLKAAPNILAGTITLQFWRKSAKSIELGADLHKEYWNKGYTTEFTKAAIDYAFNKLDINRVELRCNPKNIASNRIAEKFGFTFEGTLREYIFIEGKGFDDESVFSLLKQEYSTSHITKSLQ